MSASTRSRPSARERAYQPSPGMSRYEFNHCAKKTRYRSERSAGNHIRSRRKAGVIITETLGVYHCAICEGWHIGHSSRT
jgi:hypothetical protein